MKAGGLNLCIAQLGGSLEKGLRVYKYRVEMHVHSPIFQGQLIEKIRPITLGAREGLKNAYKRVKKAFQK